MFFSLSLVELVPGRFLLYRLSILVLKEISNEVRVEQLIKITFSSVESIVVATITCTACHDALAGAIGISSLSMISGQVAVP